MGPRLAGPQLQTAIFFSGNGKAEVAGPGRTTRRKDEVEGREADSTLSPKDGPPEFIAAPHSDRPIAGCAHGVASAST